MNYKQICPFCGVIAEGLLGLAIIRNNPFIACKCGTRVYLDCNENKCGGCLDLYNRDGELLPKKPQ